MLPFFLSRLPYILQGMLFYIFFTNVSIVL